MALQRTKLSDIQTLPSSVGVLYANPAGMRTYIRGILLHNTGSGTETVRLHNVPDAATVLGAPAAANRFAELPVAAKATVTLQFPYVIVLSDENDSIQGSSSTAATVTIQILGDKE